MQRFGPVVLVFAAGLALLGSRAGESGIATAYVDPIARIQAQDEAVYGATSIAMALHGDWLTPRFLGRYALYKPPVLYWLSAAAIKAIGRSALALRIPALVAGAATVALVFWWLLEAGAPMAAGLAGAALLLSSHLFFVLSRVGLTDSLLTFETVLAIAALARDPRLASRASLWTFGCASGAAIMTKGLAGLFPLLVLGLMSVLSRDRPAWPRLAAALAIALAVAAPWHLYQLWQHPRWFWDEYVLTEHGAWGFGSPPQTTQESQAGFYARRLIELDPLLFMVAIAALWRRPARVLLVWMVVVLAAVLGFRYRNAAYLMPALPAMALLAGHAIPRRFAAWALALAAVLFAAKSLAAKQPWGIPFAPESVNLSQRQLDKYAALHRGNDLILIEPDDQFYSADLDLPRVRYLFVDSGAPPQRLPLDFEYLGILMTAADFASLDETRAVYEQRLRQWGLNSADPIATTILARNQDQVAMVLEQHPEADFFAPAEWASRDHDVHDIYRVNFPHESAPKEFLLSRKVIQRP